MQMTTIVKCNNIGPISLTPVAPRGYPATRLSQIGRGGWGVRATRARLNLFAPRCNVVCLYILAPIIPDGWMYRDVSEDTFGGPFGCWYVAQHVLLHHLLLQPTISQDSVRPQQVM